MNLKNKIIIVLLILPTIIFAQSDFEKVLKVGEFVASGFSIFKSSSSNTKSDSKIISSICVKNKLLEKITFRITGKDLEDNKVEKEMVVQNDGKECVFNVPKGVFTYEILLANKDIYKKGEYKFDDDIVITVKKD